MTTLSFERVDVLTGTVSDLSRSAQLSMSLANLANNKGLVEVAIAAEQDSFLQTVLALHYEGKMEKNFLLWLASCLQHEAFIVFAEADILPTLFEVWQINNATESQLSLQLSLIGLIANGSFTNDLFAIAEIIECLPTIKKQGIAVLFDIVYQREEQTMKAKHLLISRMLLFMEFVRDLWFDYDIELSIEHFFPFWLNLSEGRTAAIERTAYHLLRYNDAISSSVMHQILHVLVLITMSIKEIQTDLFKRAEYSKDLWLTSEELEKLLIRFILDENFLLLTSKVNVLDYQETLSKKYYNQNQNTMHLLFLHWVDSHCRNMLDRFFLCYNNANVWYDFSFEELVKYLPPFALIRCNVLAYAHSCDWTKNIRSWGTCLTQKEAHIFHNHPFVEYPGVDNDEYIYYIWSAKVKNLGGNANLTLALYQFRGWNFDDLAFWESVIRFCVANETVLEQYFQEHANTYTNLFGYLAHKRQEEGNRFEMKGRTLRVVMQQAEEWYEEMNRHRYGHFYNPKLSWKGAAYQPFEWEKGNNIYTITQLTNNAALQAESNALHHCVSGYGQHCASGYCSIWSLRVSIDGSKEKSLVTIQIDNRHKIVQAKTSRNAQPNASHLAIIKAWAAREGIVFVRC
jgi:hypothetical protein